MIVLIAAIVIFIYGMLASMLGTIVPGLVARIGFTNAEVSYLALAQGLGLVGSSVSAGAFMDRRGRKPGIVFGLCLGTIGLILLARAKDPTISMLAMVLLGLCGGFVIVGANALVNDVSPSSKGSALNILNLFVGLGGMATPFVAGNLLHSDAVRVAYSGAAIAGLALILVLLTPIAGVTTAVLAGNDSGIFREGALYIISTVTFLYTACEFAMWNWLPKFLISAHLPAVTALNILSLGFASGMLLGRLLAATFLTRISPFKVSLAAVVLMCVSTLAMLHAETKPAFAGLVFVTGVAMAPVFPTAIAILGRICRQQSATAIGFAITCGFSGLVISSPLIAAVAGTNPQGLRCALLVIPIFSAAIAIVLLAFRKQLTTEQRL